MPSLGTVVSAAVTVSVFAGFATGFLYLLVTGLKWARNIRESIGQGLAAEERRPGGEEVRRLEGDWCWQCGRCRYQGPAINYCHRCRRPVCSGCSVHSKTDYLCASCLKIRDQDLRSGVWFFSELRERFKTTVAAIKRVDEERREDIRDVIEKLTEKLVGGSLDDVRISRLTTHPAYMGFMERYQGVLSLTLSRLTTAVQFATEDIPSPRDDPPKHVHLQLKGLIKEIIHEANSLPLFKGYARKSRSRVEDLSTKTYEDILATAILNKIIEKFQIFPKRRAKSLTGFEKGDCCESENSDPNSDSSLETGDGYSVSTDPLSMTLDCELNENPKKYLTGGGIFEDNPPGPNYGFYQNSKLEFPDFDRHHVGGKSSVNKQYDSTNKMKTDSWEENWLFKKKKLRNKTSSTVTMLVPSPIDDIKAQIGDTDADETSDFSDCSESDLVQLLNTEHQQKASQPWHTFYTEVEETENISEPHYEEISSFNTFRNNSNVDKNKETFFGIDTSYEKGSHVDPALAYSGEESIGIEQDSEYTETIERSELIAAADPSTITENNPNEKVCIFEEAVVRNTIPNLAYKPSGASFNFRLNPLFIDDPQNRKKHDSVQIIGSNSVQSLRNGSPETHYNGERLNIPLTPSTVDTSFNTLKDLRYKSKRRKCLHSVNSWYY